MLHSIPMRRISIHLISEDVPHAALLLADTGCFAPYEFPLKGQRALTETAGREYHELYHAANSRFNKIMAHVDKAVDYPQIAADHVPGLENLEALNIWLTDVWAIFSDYEERLRILDERENLLNNLTTTLDKFTGLDLDLGLLRKEKSFLDIRVGVLPEQNLARFSQAISLANYILHIFHRQQGQVYVVIAGMLSEHIDELRLVLNAANFNAIQVPPEFHDRPEILSAEMALQRQQITEERQHIEIQRSESINKYQQDLVEAWQTLKLIEPNVRLGTAIRSKGGLSVINGWIPEKEIEALDQTMQKTLAHASYIDTHSPLAKEYAEVPSAVCYPGWLRPFAMLVRNYGTPRYGEFDPTWIFMISGVLMFGAMFGDVGQGSIIALLGLVFRSKLKAFTSLIVLNGLSSIFFGYCYGSIFGAEHILIPWWQSPLRDPAMMLMLAIYFGLGFIGLMITINIYNQIRAGQYKDAIYAVNGAAGLLLMAALYTSGRSWLESGSLQTIHMLLLSLSIGLIVTYVWQQTDASASERTIIVGIELFESILGLFSNTLSFLRVAAFSLNHVALMIAIFTIADMMNFTGHWLVLILGNLFIIGFEGAIVMIQVLRLEYYEGLSRYFRGDGKLFRPLVFAGGKPTQCCYI